MATRLEGLFAAIRSHVVLNRLSRKFRSCKAAIHSLAVLGAFAFCANAFAQSGAGSIQGTVTDSTGAVVPNAAIHVVNDATNVATDTKTNNVGFYKVPDLFTGTYDITVSAPNMKTYRQRLELLVNQNAEVDAKMTAGAVTAQVTVSANLVQLTTTDSGVISDTVGQQQINQLPMNGRNVLLLMGDMTPGMASCANQDNNTCPNGMAAPALEIFADGTPLEGLYFGGENTGASNMPDPDSVQEVQTLTSGLGAKYSTPAVSIIQTKSGTNHLHGSAFETMQNNFWGVATSRSTIKPYVAPHLRQNEWGANVGGPIRIPHIYNGRDKSFFFFSWERYSSISFVPYVTLVPTAAERNGDYSNAINTSGVVPTLYDPQTTVYCTAVGVPQPWCTTANTWGRESYTKEYTEGPGAGPSNCNGDVNCIPSSAEAKDAQIYNAITPLPTNLNVIPTAISAATSGVDSGGNYAYNDQFIEFVPQVRLRLDQVFNEKNRAFLTYGDDLNTQLDTRTNPRIGYSVAGGGLPANAVGEQSLPHDNFDTSIGYTHTFSPSFFSEALVSEEWFNQYINAGGNPHYNYGSFFGLPDNFGELGFPQWNNLLWNTGGTEYAYGINQIIWDFDENLTKIIGKHQLLFGGKYRLVRVGTVPQQNADQVNFAAESTALLNPSSIANNSYSATTNTGQLNADMFLGGADSYEVNIQATFQKLHQMETDAYFEDDYRIRRNLTLNLGLRWEAHPATAMPYPAFSGFDLANDAMVFAEPISTMIAKGYTTQAIITNDETDGAKFETAQQANLPANTLTKSRDFVVEPRLGFAYQIRTGKWGTVLRGGYGKYDFPIAIGTQLSSISTGNPFSASYTMNYSSAAQSVDGLPSFQMRTPLNGTASQTAGITNAAGTPIMGDNTTGIVNSAAVTGINPGVTARFIDPSIEPDFATQVNLTIEQSLPLNSALRVSWMWAHGSDLANTYNLNAHPSTFVYEMQTGHTASNCGASCIGTNQYSSTATGPYDQTTWGTVDEDQSTGYSNDNQLQVNYQRLFHEGYAYGFWFVWQKALSASAGSPQADFVGESGNVGQIASLATTANPNINGLGIAVIPPLPPPPPTGYPNWKYYRALAKFEGQVRSTTYPPFQFQWNGIVDIPVGRGKRFLGNANRFVDELVGGYQIATNANSTMGTVAVSSSNWGPDTPIHRYKKGIPVQDCTSGTCHKEYLFFNGYIAPTQNANTGCTSKCVNNLPASYQPYEVPIDNVPGSTYYSDNEVGILLTGSTTPAAIAYSPGPGDLNPYAKTVMNTFFNWSEDASLYKVFPIKEGMFVRFNMDAFNVFNIQGQPGPNSTTGLTGCTDAAYIGGCSSVNSPRVVQFTLRFTF
jgi:hypothetical protein